MFYRGLYLPWFDVILAFADTVELVMAVVVIFELGVIFDNAELVAWPSARLKHTSVDEEDPASAHVTAHAWLVSLWR